MSDGKNARLCVVMRGMDQFCHSTAGNFVSKCPLGLEIEPRFGMIAAVEVAKWEYRIQGSGLLFCDDVAVSKP